MKALTKKGFTLAELLIVMAIVVVLAAIAIPTFGKQLETARETSDMEGLRAVYEDVLSYAILDASDGTLDGKNGATTLAVTGLAYASNKYTVTLNGESCWDPKYEAIQSGNKWQFVNATIDGHVVPDALDSSGKKIKTIVFEFEIATDGRVKLVADNTAAETPTTAITATYN